MLEGCLHGAFGNFVEHHPKRRNRRFLGHDLFGEMLADGFAFTIRVSGEIDRVSALRRPFQIGNDLLIVTLFRVGNDLVFRFEVVLDVDPQAL
jgi:hypothetical protein